MGRYGKASCEYAGVTLHMDCVSWYMNGRWYLTAVLCTETEYEKAADLFNAAMLSFSTEAPSKDRLYYLLSINEGGTTLNAIETFAGTGVDVRDFYLLLHDDGTGYMQFGDSDDAGDITWDETTLTAEGESIPYTLNGDHIVIQIEEESAEFAPAAEVEALLAAQPETPAQPDTPAPSSDWTKADLIGTWTMTGARAYGQTLTQEQIGRSMELTLSEDGSAVLTADGSSSEIEWVLQEDNTILLQVGGIELYTLTFDGAELVLTTMGVDLVFTKN